MPIVDLPCSTGPHGCSLKRLEDTTWTDEGVRQGANEAAVPAALIHQLQEAEAIARPFEALVDLRGAGVERDMEIVLGPDNTIGQHKCVAGPANPSDNAQRCRLHRGLLGALQEFFLRGGLNKKDPGLLKADDLVFWVLGQSGYVDLENVPADLNQFEAVTIFVEGAADEPNILGVPKLRFWSQTGFGCLAIAEEHGSPF
jgi:hypothetical protein